MSQRNTKATAPPAIDSDTRRLIHELRVHQIELEMQNEELVRSRAEVDALLRRYTDLYDFAPMGYFTLARDGAIHQVNLAGSTLLGAERGKLIKRRFALFVSAESRPIFGAFLEKVFSTSGGKETCQFAVLRDGRKPIWAHIEAISVGDGEKCRAVVSDITESRRAEETLRHRLAELEALHTVSGALRTAQTREEALPILLDETLAVMEIEAGIIWLYYPGSDELRVAASRGRFRQLDKAPIKPGEGIAGAVFASGQSSVSGDSENNPAARAMTRGQTQDGLGSACVAIRAGSETVGVLLVFVPLPRQITPEQVNLLESLAEMAGAALHRMRLYEETSRQLDQLGALHRVDQAISASVDLRMMLGVLLEHVTSQMKVDAASVLLLNPNLQTLEYAAGRGFRTHTARTARIRLGESLAGRAALERRAVQADDFAQIHENPHFAALWAGEGFAAYYGMPLIAKGKVIGVLEVFHRSPLPAGPEWVSFFETLAGQAAIAIDNGQLFDNLQLSNTDLALAYEATIEGWSHALDLRDKETEGHTLRVTEMTLRLARAMGISEAEIAPIRHGALLHDIGKMGVPDSILLKPDKLTDDEWIIMRRHPQLAYDMLAPIAYLRPALDIPYCHHEKWDGTGYPRGLHGEQIPVAARVFAVVDVWDALRSDRPYRDAWPEEEVLEHFKAGSGTHFDPKAVELFLKVVHEDS